MKCTVQPQVASQSSTQISRGVPDRWRPGGGPRRSVAEDYTAADCNPTSAAIRWIRLNLQSGDVPTISYMCMRIGVWVDTGLNNIRRSICGDAI